MKLVSRLRLGQSWLSIILVEFGFFGIICRSYYHDAIIEQNQLLNIICSTLAKSLLNAAVRPALFCLACSKREYNVCQFVEWNSNNNHSDDCCELLIEIFPYSLELFLVQNFVASMKKPLELAAASIR